MATAGRPRTKPARPGFNADLGRRLRAIREGHGLSLHAVEMESRGEWKAVVVGSYERGERTTTVERLVGLCAWYGADPREVLTGEPVQPPALVSATFTAITAAKNAEQFQMTVEYEAALEALREEIASLRGENALLRAHVCEVAS